MRCDSRDLTLRAIVAAEVRDLLECAGLQDAEFCQRVLLHKPCIGQRPRRAEHRAILS
jgi:hypothetical protein